MPRKPREEFYPNELKDITTWLVVHLAVLQPGRNSFDKYVQETGSRRTGKVIYQRFAKELPRMSEEGGRYGFDNIQIQDVMNAIGLK